MDGLADVVFLQGSGEDSSDVVSILLQQTSEADDSELSLASLIHQAMVRRDVVVKLTAWTKSRGHRAYQHVDMEQVCDTAKQLPANSVPPEIIKRLPLGALLDKRSSSEKAQRLHRLRVLSKKQRIIWKYWDRMVRGCKK